MSRKNQAPAWCTARGGRGARHATAALVCHSRFGAQHKSALPRAQDAREWLVPCLSVDPRRRPSISALLGLKFFTEAAMKVW